MEPKRNKRRDRDEEKKMSGACHWGAALSLSKLSFESRGYSRNVE